MRKQLTKESASLSLFSLFSTLQPNCNGAGMPGDILGTYYSGTPGHISTPIAAVTLAFSGAKILHVSGCTHPWCGSSGLPDAPDLPAVAAAAAKADLVLFFGGVSGHVASGITRATGKPNGVGPPGQLDYYHMGSCHDPKNQVSVFSVFSTFLADGWKTIMICHDRLGTGSASETKPAKNGDCVSHTHTQSCHPFELGGATEGR
jgi:hypothetical protein